MRVLLTGGSGFIGGALNTALIAYGFKVLALCRNQASANELAKSGSEIVLGSITDQAVIESAISQVDGVFHLAGVVSHHSRDAAIMEDANVRGTETIIAALKDTSKRLVHISSVAAVGALFNPGSPLNEESEYNLTHLALPYFETKRRAELSVVAAATNAELNAVVINPSTVFGPKDGLKGSRKAHVKAVFGKLLACPIGGVSIASIDAVCQAIIAAYFKGRVGERYILGGDNITIAEMFQIIASAAGSQPPCFQVPTPLLKLLGYLCRPLELLGVSMPINLTAVRTATLYHWYSSDKARAELGYLPLSAKDALGESVEWILGNTPYL